MTAYVAPYGTFQDWQRQVASSLNAMFQRFVIDYTDTPFGSSYYSNAKLAVNGATPDTWYSSLQGGSTATDAITAAVSVPSTASVHQTNAVAAYVQSNRAQPGNGGDVAGYFQAVANANNSAVFALNLVTADTSGKTGQILTNEFDFNVSAADTTVTGINLILVANTALTGSRNAFRADKAFGNNGWSNGLVTADGAIDLYAAFIGSQTSTAGTNRDGQKIGLVSYDSSNNQYIASIFGDHTGGMAIRPGATGGAVAIQDPGGTTNWVYFNSQGVHTSAATITEQAAAAVPTPLSGTQTLFIDTADHKLKRKDSSGTVTIIA